MAGFSFHHFAGLFRRRTAQKGEAENHHQINSFWISLCLIQWSFIAFQQMVYFPSPLAHTSANRHTLLSVNKLPRQEKNLSPWIYRWFHSRCEANRQSISNTGRHRAQVSSHINHNAWIGNDKTDAVCFLIIGLLDCDTNKHNVKAWISTNKSSNAVSVFRCCDFVCRFSKLKSVWARRSGEREGWERKRKGWMTGCAGR